MSNPDYVLMLFVAGDEPHSRLARRNLSEFCERELSGRCRIEVIDVLEDIDRALEHGVLLTPSLLCVAPHEGVWVLGNLSDRNRLRLALRLTDREDNRS